MLTLIKQKPKIIRSFSTVSNKYRVLFFGSNQFAMPHLKAILDEQSKPDSCIDKLAVVLSPDKVQDQHIEKSTPNKTKRWLESHLDVFHTPPQMDDINDWEIPIENYDLGVVASFGYFIPSHHFLKFKHGAMNVHPSLCYKGPSAIEHTIMMGDTETGVCIHQLTSDGVFSGPVLAQKKIQLHEPPTYSKLEARLADIGSQLVVDTIRHLDQRQKQAQPSLEPGKKIPKINSDWSEMDFVNMSAWQAEQIHRAIGHEYPLRTIYQTHTDQKDVLVQLLDLSLVESPSLSSVIGSAPGSFAYDQASQCLLLVFGDDSLVACKQLAVGQERFSAAEFIQKYQTKGKFGASLGVDDKVIEDNMKKRDQMKEFKV